MAKPIRVPLIEEVEPRLADSNKDALPVNTFYDKDDVSVYAVKRPGITSYLTGLGQAAGIYHYDDSLFSFYGNILWKDVIWTGDVFCAVGYTSTANYDTVYAALSEDGLDWNCRPIKVPPTISTYVSILSNVAKSNSTYCLIGLSNPATSSRVSFTSTDGITWSESAFPGSGSVGWDITSNGSEFVAVANSSGAAVRAYQSTDGVTWNPGNLSARNWGAVAYGNSTYVAVANNQTVGAATSSNGTSWTDRTLTQANRYSVCYGNGKFFSPRYGSNKGDTSTDGITWTEVTLPASRFWVDCYWTGEQFIAVAERDATPGATSYLAYSTNGTTWSEVALPAFSTPDGAFTSNAYVTCAGNTDISVALNRGYDDVSNYAGYIGNEYAYSVNNSSTYTMGNLGAGVPFPKVTND